MQSGAGSSNFEQSIQDIDAANEDPDSGQIRRVDFRCQNETLKIDGILTLFNETISTEVTKPNIYSA